MTKRFLIFIPCIIGKRIWRSWNSVFPLICMCVKKCLLAVVLWYVNILIYIGFICFVHSWNMIQIFAILILLLFFIFYDKRIYNREENLCYYPYLFSFWLHSGMFEFHCLSDFGICSLWSNNHLKWTQRSILEVSGRFAKNIYFL